MKLLLHDVYTLQPFPRTSRPCRSSDLEVIPTLLVSHKTNISSNSSNKLMCYHYNFEIIIEYMWNYFRTI